MSCSNPRTCQLYFPFPSDDIQTDFKIYFSSDEGLRRDVIKCQISQDHFGCGLDSGFRWEKLNSTHALITLPTNVAATSGIFKSEIDGHENTTYWTCLWSSVDSCSVKPEGGVCGTHINSLFCGTKWARQVEKQFLNIGAVNEYLIQISFALCVLLFIGFVIYILLSVWRKRKSLRSKRYYESSSVGELALRPALGRLPSELMYRY